MMTFDSAHSDPRRKLVTLTDTIGVCKRRTTIFAGTKRGAYSRFGFDGNLEPAKGLEPPTY